MDRKRRMMILCAAWLPAWPAALSLAREDMTMEGSRQLLSDFARPEPYVHPGTRWRAFSDRVMGGVSDAAFNPDVVAGRGCVRLTGRVTRDNGGGFIQMTLDLGTRDTPFDASAWQGIELHLHGNDEDYNVHVRTRDCGWYDQSYRATLHAASRWQVHRLDWRDFTPNGVRVPLDPSRLERIALLGWMREFQADIALAQLALVGTVRPAG